ncbi:MAG TPA: hypothetical protein VFM05_04225 [Candidatus Saccharimonadales bacterium]|nr:hypothetical protein [Candidatus Saccharimonadales bacterium]
MDADSPNKPEDDYQAASRATAEEQYEEYASHSEVYSAPKRTWRKVGIVMIIVFVLAAGGFAAYWFLARDKGDTKDASQANDLPATSQRQENDQTNKISEETEHYASQSFMLEFDYPKDWKIEEATSGGVLTVRSPALRLKSATGQSMNAQVVLTFRNKQQPLPEFDKGNAVAARESEKVTYAKPSSVQRGSTYLSFLRYAGTTASALDGIYITGDFGYQKDQAIPKADLVPVDPVISVTFLECADESCAGEAMAAGLDASIWEDQAFATPLRKMFQSLVVN